ncbi:carbohydrate ABC transporter permease [Terribacillus saccharophilus]|uniref:ABC transporter permease n=1 Tax=Terribacillus saccharophilus TaxID=361277 RepID=A0A075LKY1_9BACI|nr:MULTISPECIES: sugar ABC transporter permease [Terribacillus]AIF67004.1 ABC transporter permease [Terribacillus goriensis]MCM3224242.1 sugar ABC transporter permease [Terribacillus saccharophilus]MEC0283850.1 sugar ABC transporter permease [Terribacillus saccharophilus]MEC0290806.1 sugar ABC transporter permease [Terribacillus saccharophilus]MEC0304674.1 sugar ABC transporter permease [Terribacillus saccharophilus]
MSSRLRSNLWGYLFIGPFIIGFLAFTIIPMLASLYFSFTDYGLFDDPVWIGFENYIKMFTEDPRYINSLKVTIIYVFAGVPLRLAFALLVAMLLNVGSRAVGWYRTLYYLPSLIGGSVAVAIMWRNIFGDDGIVNIALKTMGIDSIRWFGEPTAALWMLIFLSIWQFGSSMLIFLAGLKSIPASFYEAASVDGANFFQKFFRITLPMLSPVLLFNIIMQTISAFMTFVPAFIISKGTGGPLDGTLLYSLYLFKQGFEYFNMGYASAMAWVMLVIVGILTGIIFLTSKYWVHYESEGK